MSIWVGRYAIVDGVVREHGPWFVERIRTREDETVRLLVLAEPVDTRSAQFAAEVADAIADLFARESLSVTGGLLRALRQAHANLAEWNRRSLREHRVAVGITCVAIRDGEVTVAQAGPGVVYISGPAGVQRYVAEGAALEPVGGSEPIEPQFTSTRIEERLVLLLTSVVEEALTRSTIENALETGAERALAELFMRTRNIPNMSAALIAEVDLPEELLAGSSAVVDSEDEARRPWRDPREPGAGLTTSPAPRAVDSGVEFLEAARARASRIALPTLRRERSGYGSLAGGPGALSRVGVRNAGGGAGFPVQQWRGAALSALALLSVLFLAWCTLPGFVSQDRDAQLDDAIAAATAQLNVAAQASDVASSRTALDAADAELAKARGIAPNDSRIAELQQQADAAGLALDAVVDLGDAGLKRIIGFDGAITAPFNMASLAFGDNALWLMDSQRGRIFRVETAGGQPTEVYRTGATYGGTIARDPRAIAWDASSQRLLILDAGPTLFILRPGGAPTPSVVRGARDIRSIAAITAYSGNLYVLDPQGGEIWRYLPGGEGFDSERSGILGGVDLGDAKAFAVDGDFYVLGNSAVRHFRPPRELEQLLQGIDRPISSAAGLAADAQRQLFYIGDRGGRRIVVSDRNGAYRRQYRHPAFIDVRGVALSADGSTVFVLTGDGVHSFQPTP